MSQDREQVSLYEWKVVAVADDALESTLNRYQAEWEIFSVVPTIKFSASMMMGAPMPSAVYCNVLLRRPKK